jgi:hypothetical protein
MFPIIVDYFKLNTHPKIIDLRDINESDKAYLVKQGISLDYLLRNLSKTMTGAYLDPLSFQLTAIKDNAVYAVCPFTGNLLASRHSLLASISTIFYRFNSVQAFYIVIAGLDGFMKNAIYFPQQELVVITGKPWTFEEADLIELQARAVCHFGGCYRYLSDNNAAKRGTAVCVGFFHFAHHLWNELPGIDRLLRKKILSRVDKFLLLREPLGAIEQIFPEIPADKIERKYTTDTMFQNIVTKNYFAIKVGDDLITEELVNRVYEVAKQNCRPETLDAVQNARRQHFPLLWVGIRVGSRMWINQIDGLAKLIDTLHTEFPRLGVVFDGFSLPADRSDKSSDNREYDEILREENRVVTDIMHRLERHPQALGIYNIVGSSIYDANVWAHAIDVYVSPYGTLQHKVGWFANKPGTIHSNKTVLQWTKHLWAGRENAIKPRAVRYAGVVDAQKIKQAVIYRETSDWHNESGAGIQSMAKRVQSDPEFDNYELDWEALYSDLIDLIRSPKMLHKLDREIMALACKRKIKKALHVLTNYVDRDKI